MTYYSPGLLTKTRQIQQKTFYTLSGLSWASSLPRPTWTTAMKWERPIRMLFPVRGGFLWEQWYRYYLISKGFMGFRTEISGSWWNNITADTYTGTLAGFIRQFIPSSTLSRQFLPLFKNIFDNTQKSDLVKDSTKVSPLSRCFTAISLPF